MRIKLSKVGNKYQGIITGIDTDGNAIRDRYGLSNSPGGALNAPLKVIAESITRAILRGETVVIENENADDLPIPDPEFNRRTTIMKNKPTLIEVVMAGGIFAIIGAGCLMPIGMIWFLVWLVKTVIAAIQGG